MYLDQANFDKNSSYTLRISKSFVPKPGQKQINKLKTNSVANVAVHEVYSHQMKKRPYKRKCTQHQRFDEGKQLYKKMERKKNRTLGIEKQIQHQHDLGETSARPQPDIDKKSTGPQPDFS